MFHHGILSGIVLGIPLSFFFLQVQGLVFGIVPVPGDSALPFPLPGGRTGGTVPGQILVVGLGLFQYILGVPRAWVAVGGAVVA